MKETILALVLMIGVTGCTGFGGGTSDAVKDRVTAYNNKQAIDSLDNICNRIDVGVAKKEFQFGTGSERQEAWSTLCLDPGSSEPVKTKEAK